MNGTLTVLNRFERKTNEPIDKQWREKTLKGELTESDLIRLLYVAVERGYIEIAKRQVITAGNETPFLHKLILS